MPETLLRQQRRGELQLTQNKELRLRDAAKVDINADRLYLSAEPESTNQINIKTKKNEPQLRFVLFALFSPAWWRASCARRGFRH